MTPLLHANRFYAYFYGGKRVVFYIYTLYILKNCSLLCATASRPCFLFWQVSKLVYYYSLNVWETRRFLMTIKLDKIDTDLSKHCNSPSALLQLTEQHIVYIIIRSKFNKKVCVLLRSKLNGDVQQYTTILLLNHISMEESIQTP